MREDCVANFEASLPDHQGELSLTHNEHKTSYMTVAEYVDSFEYIEFVSEAEKALAIETNEMWNLHWYPNTPVGFNAMCAAKLSALMAWVGEQ